MRMYIHIYIYVYIYICPFQIQSSPKVSDFCFCSLILQLCTCRANSPQEGTIAIHPKKGQQQGQSNWYVGPYLINFS